MLIVTLYESTESQVIILESTPFLLLLVEFEVVVLLKFIYLRRLVIDWSPMDSRGLLVSAESYIFGF